MAKTCETQDTLVSNSGIAKHTPGRAQALPNACCTLPPSLQKDRDTLIEQSNIPLKRSMTIRVYYNGICFSNLLYQIPQFQLSAGLLCNEWLNQIT